MPTSLHGTRPLAVAASVAVLLVAACSAGSASPGASAGPSPAGSASPAPSVAASAAPSATATPSAIPSGSATTSAAPSASAAAAGTLASALYPFTWALPPEAFELTPTLAKVPWDGKAVMDSSSDYNDRFYLPGSKLTFVFAAPTSKALEAYATEIHDRAVQDHGCAAALDLRRTVTLDGSPAVLGTFPCQGLTVLELSTVHDGVGLVIKQLAPPDDPAVLADAFQGLLKGFRWTR